MAKVLILGGTGRIGSNVARDLLARTSGGSEPPQLILSGRNAARGTFVSQELDADRCQFLELALDDQDRLQTAISDSDLVIHCAGPFLNRDARVLRNCIRQQIPYLDVSDSRDFTALALSHHHEAIKHNSTAIINSGIFPGISNSMVRQAVEQLDSVDRIDLSYVVAGSGGAGITVLRTTFLGLLHPFDTWQNNRWQPVPPYSDRQTVTFPHYGDAPVYWFDVPETLTLPQSFPQVHTVTTKFGSLPDFYNHLTWLMARGIPSKLMANPATIEFLSRVSFAMTQVSDHFTGIGVAIRAEVTGTKENQLAKAVSSLYCDDTAYAAGVGTGSIAVKLLTNSSCPTGVHPVERILSTAKFSQIMQASNIPLKVRCEFL